MLNELTVKEMIDDSSLYYSTIRNQDITNDHKIALFIECMKRFAKLPDAVFVNAVEHHRMDARHGQWMWGVNDVVRQIQELSLLGHPTPDEAWAQASQAVNEGQTVVWTTLTKEAYFESFGLKDEPVAHRKAFLDIYRKKMVSAVAFCVPAEVSVSRGHDKHQAVAAIQRAVEQGLLIAQQAENYLPAQPKAHATVNAAIRAAAAPARLSSPAVTPAPTGEPAQGGAKQQAGSSPRDYLRTMKDILSQPKPPYPDERLAQEQRRRLQQAKQESLETAKAAEARFWV